MIEGTNSITDEERVLADQQMAEIVAEATDDNVGSEFSPEYMARRRQADAVSREAVKKDEGLAGEPLPAGVLTQAKDLIEIAQARKEASTVSERSGKKGKKEITDDQQLTILEEELKPFWKERRDLEDDLENASKPSWGRIAGNFFGITKPAEQIRKRLKELNDQYGQKDGMYRILKAERQS